jgi:hypothetical protein
MAFSGSSPGVLREFSVHTARLAHRLHRSQLFSTRASFAGRMVELDGRGDDTRPCAPYLADSDQTALMERFDAIYAQRSAFLTCEL